MFKRLFWLTVGATAGFGAAFWLMVRVRETAAKLTPEGLTAELSKTMRQLGADLRAAASEGRAGMRETEEQIRQELASPSIR